MENSAIDEERSTYTEGESRSRKSSILKPPKARAPLQELDLGGDADDTEDFDTLRKRRVSFAGVNSVKEFCSQAETLQVCHIQSYEETFSTSSDNSHNSSAAKSVLQLVTPKNAVPSGEDRNFADDPMDLTDSIMDNNQVPNESAPPTVIPVFTPCAQLSEPAMNRKANLPSYSSRKSVAVSNAQNSMVDGNMTSSNMSISSVVGAPAQRIPGHLDTPVAPNSPLSCSMEITEPVQIPQNGMPPNQPILFPPFRNSFKLPEQSDSGMEFTEAVPVRIRPFSINQANDNFGDTSMEMTEVVKKTDIQYLCSQMSFPNKSASMDFTEVVKVQRKSAHFHNFQSSSMDNSTGNCGMEFTEPIKGHLVRSDPSERLPCAQQPIPAEKGYTAPHPIHHVSPFPRGNNQGFSGSERDCEKSIVQSPENRSSSDMEMTGVLSLAKYNKLFNNDDDVDDMDFTQLLSVNGPKKARMSNEPEEEPFQMISLSTEVTDKPLHQNKPLTPRDLIPTSIAADKFVCRTEPLLTNSDEPVTALNHFEDDGDTLALNFKNIKRGNSPIELSFLMDSSSSDRPTGKVITGHNLTLNENAGPLDHEHLLLYSPPKNSKPFSRELKKTPGFEGVSMPIEPLNQMNATDLHQPLPACHLNTQKCPINSFEAQVVNEQQNFEPKDPLRIIRSSRSFMGDVSLPIGVRASFKDFEIKPDSMVENESLPTVCLDDSDILKAGLNDMTCPERVPFISMSMTSNLASPCSKSRMSLADRTTFVNSVTQEVEKTCEQIRANSFEREFGGNVGSIEACKNQYINRSETHDDQDTSVAMPFVGKPLPDRRKSETHKFSQSIPVIECEESLQHQELKSLVTADVCLPNQRSPVGIMRFPSTKNSNPNQLISDREANEQDTSMSMPCFVFKAVSDKRCSDVHKLGQSFPITECGDTQSSAKMELTEVTLPNNIEPRKSIARMNFAPEESSMQLSCSSGQMVPTDAVAIDRKSICPNQTATPHDSSGIEMDETLMQMKSPKRDNVSEVCLYGMGSTEGPITTSCDMEETNVKPKDVDDHRKSLFPLAQSPLSLTSEETIARPNTPNVACVIEQSRKSCVSIDNEDTLTKSLLMNLEVSPKHISSGAADIMDIEQQNALSPPIRLSAAPENRKTVFDSLTSPKRDAVEGLLNLTKQDSSALRCTNQTFRGSDMHTSTNEMDGLNQFLNIGLDNPDELKSTSVNRRSDFFSAVDKPHGSFPSAQPSSKESGLGMVCDAHPEDEYCIKQVNNVKTLPVTAAIEVTNQTFRGNDVHTSANEMAGLNQFFNVGLNNPDGLKSTNVNRCSDFFSAVDEPLESFPPGWLSCRKSGFDMLGEDHCNEQEKNVHKSPEYATNEITSGNALGENNVVDEKSDSIQASSEPPFQKVPESEGYHEHNDREMIKADMRLSRESVHFCNTEKEDAEELCSGIILNPENKTDIDVERDDDCSSDLLSTNGCGEIQLSRYCHEPAENQCALPRRSGRKSCIGVLLDKSTDVEGECNLKPNSEDASGEFEFAIRRNKRKSTIGTRQSENYPDIDPQNPEDYHKLDVTPLDGQQYEPEMSIVPATGSAELEPQDIVEDVDLSQEMMNVSLNDGEFSESELEKLHTTSTPCKPRTSCTRNEDSSWDRKRNRSSTVRTPSLTIDLAHDLSQEMMNISIQSDTRSPLPKKLSIHPLRKSTLPTTDKGLLSEAQSNRGLPVYEGGCNLAVESVKVESVDEISKNSETLKGDLPYETRVENDDLMSSHGFYLLGCQTDWETLLYDKVLGIKVVLPLCKFTEQTKIKSVQYTFYSWRIGQTLFQDRETVEFIRSRITRNMPQEWLREECSKIGDLDRLVSSLRNEIEMLKPSINQLDYVKRRHPATISNDRFSFRIINLDVRVHFEVTLELNNSHKMSDCCITVKNVVGKVNLDTVRLVFRALPSSDVDVLYRFVRCLDSETSQFLARE